MCFCALLENTSVEFDINSGLWSCLSRRYLWENLNSYIATNVECREINSSSDIKSKLQLYQLYAELACEHQDDAKTMENCNALSRKSLPEYTNYVSLYEQFIKRPYEWDAGMVDSIYE